MFIPIVIVCMTAGFPCWPLASAPVSEIEVCNTKIEGLLSELKGMFEHNPQLKVHRKMCMSIESKDTPKQKERDA